MLVLADVAPHDGVVLPIRAAKSCTRRKNSPPQAEKFSAIFIYGKAVNTADLY
jgi:hypothetical protein